MAPSPSSVLMLGVVFVALASRAAAAQDTSSGESVAVGVETDVGSVYLFRGRVYSTGAVAQSRAWLSTDGLDLYAWTNVALRASPGARVLDEVDVGASYALRRAGFAAIPALDVYMYRLSDGERASGAISHTVEASLAVSYTRGGTVVSTKHVVDARSYRGAYFVQVAAAHVRPLTPRTEFEVTAFGAWASRKFNRSYFGPGIRGLGLAGVNVSVTRQAGRRVYLKPHAELSCIPAPPLRAAVSRPCNVALGLAVGLAR